MTSLRTKLTVLLVVPLALLVVLALFGVRSATQAKDRADEAALRLDVAIAADDTALALIQERRLLAVTPGGDGHDDQQKQTDQTVEVLVDRIARLSTDRQEAIHTTDAFDAIADLPAIRAAIDADTPADEVLAAYGPVVDAVLRLDGAFDDATDSRTFTELQAQRALVRVVERVAFEESLLEPALRTGTVSPDRHNDLTRVVASEDLWTERFLEAAGPAQIDGFTQLRSTQSVTSAERLRDRVLAAGPSDAVDEDALLWATAMDKKLDLLIALTADGAAELDSALSSRRSDAGRAQLTAYGLLLAALTAFALVLPALRRLVTRPLQDLADQAQHTADALGAAADVGDDLDEIEPLELPGDDELHDIADAFNTLRSTAVGLADRQATTRDDVHEVFLNFGRRAQNLVTQQLGQIDDLEARTDDPDVLADLFMLDHLATRLRRTAESMAVLAGAESPRPWARPVSMANVVRAAAAEAIDYSRVDVAHVTPAAVTGTAANDVSHLLAEFVDNALTYSPPESRVTIAGDRHPNGGYVITVTDAGLGMAPSRLSEANARLAGEPGAYDAGRPLAKYFGLHIAGRLGRRHGIGLRLVPSPLNGIRAEVVLPRPLIALPGANLAPALGAPPSAASMPAPGSRFGPPTPPGSDQVRRRTVHPRTDQALDGPAISLRTAGPHHD